MIDIFSQIWVWVASVAGGITFAGIITAILYGCLKGAFSKTISKINVQKIADEATEKGVERVKKVAFTHSIEPLVESELEKINEKSTALIKDELASVQAKYDKLVNVLDKLAAYFDNSIGVSDKAKKELHEAVEGAKEKAPAVESHVESEVITEDKKEKVSTKGQKKQVLVER